MEAAVLTAIASPRRQEILRLVWAHERSAGDIHRAMPDVTFGAVSLQLKTLTDAGLLRMRAAGRHRFYRADRETLKPVAPVLERMWDDALWRLKLAAELTQTRRGPRPRPASPKRRQAGPAPRREGGPASPKRRQGGPASSKRREGGRRAGRKRKG
jgi:DNA-binding transcriptional ArsR family regulator